jgi:hypothetical protein
MSSTWKEPPKYNQTVHAHVINNFFSLAHKLEQTGRTKEGSFSKGKVHIKTNLNGGERTVQRKYSHLLEDANQRPLMAGEDEAGGHISQEVHVGRLIERRAGEESV